MATTETQQEVSTVSKGASGHRRITRKAVAVRPERSTGPRTLRGKKRSSKNALKHGIFSKVAVLTSESRADYKELLGGLQDYWQPEGKMEELLVDKLAVLFWRYKRVTQAETAEIERVAEFLEQSEWTRQLKAADTCEDLASFSKGMLYHASNPHVIERVVELLEGLRDQIKVRGLDLDKDKDLLIKIYGSPVDGEIRSEFFLRYAVLVLELQKDSKTKDSKANDEWVLRPEDSSRLALRAVDKEIKMLKQLQKSCEEEEEKKLEYAEKAAVIPPEGTMVRLMRYEASLERSIDRTLIQLERFQRMRAGQAVPPPLKVEVTRER